MRPVICIQGRVVQTRSIAAGTAVGYCYTWVAQHPSRIATVALGYADGYLRSLSDRGMVSCKGVDLPLIGNISMDTITVDITDARDGLVVEGGYVELLDPLRDLDTVAARAGTIGYEILTSLGQRYARCYLENDGVSE